MASAERVDEDELLAVFDRRADSAEPLTLSEIADAAGTHTEAVSGQLRSLTEKGYLRSKRVEDRTRVWWSSPGTDNRDTRPEAPPGDARGEGPLIDVGQVLEASPAGVVVVTDSGEISFANERAGEILALEDDEITDLTYRHPAWDIYDDDGTPIPVEDHPVTRVIETGEPVYGFEHWIARPDGTERWLLSNVAPIPNDDGGVDAVVVGFEDASRLKQREEKLTSEERRAVELSSEDLFGPFLEAAAGDVHVRVDHVREAADGETLQHISATGLSSNALAECFRQRPDVLDVRLLGTVDDEVRLEVQVAGPTVPLVFDELGGRVVSLLETRADGSPALVGELPGDVTAREAVQAVREVVTDVELLSQRQRYSPRLLFDVVEDELTDRQFTALRTAYYRGYFDTHRTITGDELASRLDITRQTFHTHLRKAERRVLARLFEGGPDTAAD